MSYGRMSTFGSSSRRKWLAAACLAVSVVVSTACAGNHRDQPRYDPQDESRLFAGGQSARPIVGDTVARGQLQEDTVLYTGKDGAKYLRGFPFPVTKEVLDRGQDRYEISCVPCHGEVGNGDGMIVRRGYSRPPSYHIDRLRNVEEGYLYEVITIGFGTMPSYADQVAPRDRWAIVAYLRALQLSQNAKADDLSPQDRAELEKAGE